MFLVNLCFIALLVVAYLVLFPSRVGDTSRVSFVDRITLAFRMGIARGLLIVCPFWSLGESKDKKKQKQDDDDLAAARFMSASDAVKKFIAPHSVVYFSGFAASESPAAWSHAIKAYACSRKQQQQPQPLALTIVTQTGSSLRGVGSDSIDNVITDTPAGTVKRLIAGHLETCVGTLRALSSGNERLSKLEVFNLPLGVVSRLVGVQANAATTTNNLDRAASSETVHNSKVQTTVGVGSYLEEQDAFAISDSAKKSNIKKLLLQRVLVKKTDNGGNEQSQLVYAMPPIHVACIHARFADQDGNIYFSESTLISDAIAAARAAKKNGGFVLVSVQQVRNMTKSEQQQQQQAASLKAIEVDAIVHAKSILLEDFSGLARHCRLLPQSAAKKNNSSNSIDREEILALWERANLGYGLATTFHSRWRSTHRDTAVITHAHDEVLRIAKILTSKRNLSVVRVMIGVSLPELVAIRLAESGLAYLGSHVTDSNLARSASALPDERDVDKLLQRERDLLPPHLQKDIDPLYREPAASAAATTTTNSLSSASSSSSVSEPPCLQFVVESGVVGGLPAPGFLFGNSFNPYKILQGPTLWEGLASRKFVHVCVLGAGEVDVQGRVNVSRGGPQVRDVIGCGGFPDIVDGTAFAIVIVVSISSAGTRFSRKHNSSIVQEVQQVTFDPLQALKRDCVVRYCTEFGVFHAEICRGGEVARLVAPPGLELLVQERCKVRLLAED